MAHVTVSPGGGTVARGGVRRWCLALVRVGLVRVTGLGLSPRAGGWLLAGGDARPRQVRVQARGGAGASRGGSAAGWECLRVLPAPASAAGSRSSCLPGPKLGPRPSGTEPPGPADPDPASGPTARPFGPASPRPASPRPVAWPRRLAPAVWPPGTSSPATASAPSGLAEPGLLGRPVRPAGFPATGPAAAGPLGPSASRPRPAGLLGPPVPAPSGPPGPLNSPVPRPSARRPCDLPGLPDRAVRPTGLPTPVLRPCDLPGPRLASSPRTSALPTPPQAPSSRQPP